MDNNLVVVVGSGVFTTSPLPGQDILATAIENRGFNVEKVFREHPRDIYVHNKGRYFRKKDHGKHAEGGMILEGIDYLLISENAFVESEWFSLEDAKTGRIDREAYREWTKQRTEALYGTRVYVLRSKQFMPQGTEGHLDYPLLLLPHSRILLIDDGEANKTIEEEALQEVVRTEDLEVIHHFDPSYHSCGKPLNALVLSDKGRDVVFHDRNARQLGRLLERKGVEAISVDFPPFSQAYALPFIHCSVNTYTKDVAVTIDFLLER